MSNKTTGKATSGRVRRKKKKVTNTLAGTTKSTSSASTKTISSISSINSSINSVVNSISNYSDQTDQLTGCSSSSTNNSTKTSYSLDNSVNQHTNQLNTHNQLNNNQSNLIYCDNNQNNFTNGQQYLNSSYYTPSPFNKQTAQDFKANLNNTQLNSSSSPHLVNSNNLLSNSNLDNLNNLNNSLNQYLPNHQTFCANKDTKAINKFDRTMMDCKPLINSNQNPFGNSTSNQLNLSSNSIGTYNNAGKLPFCCGCKKAILDRFFLQTMNSFYHG